MKPMHKAGLAAAVASVAVVGAFTVTNIYSTSIQTADSGVGEVAPGEFTAREITVYMDPNCGCCGGWAEYMEAHGHQVTIERTNQIAAVKSDHQVPPSMMSCHTAVIDGVVIEGHIPAEAVEQFLTMSELPFGDRTVGISVPAMPHGSPGMETGRFDDYDVLAFTADGDTAVIHEVRH